jgi:hypothetical protein
MLARNSRVSDFAALRVPDAAMSPDNSEPSLIGTSNEWSAIREPVEHTVTNRRYFALLVPLSLACPADDSGTAAEQLRATAAGAGPVCEVLASNVPLPIEVRESSGLARSARDRALFWTHNDAGNAPELFAVDETGVLVQRVRVTGTELIDWEDLEAAACGNDRCLYVGDIGDNDGDRDRITVYRVVEPERSATETQPAEALYARYPDGPKDAEALFADASGTLYVVTKGRRSAISLYRWPLSSATGQTTSLEHVRELYAEPVDERDRVTAATVTPNGRWIGIRTYRSLHLHSADALLGQGTAEPVTFDLSSLGQEQGESLVLADDGTAWLSSEAEDGGRPRWARLKCVLPGG